MNILSNNLKMITSQPVFDIFSMNVIGLIIDIVILYYLFRPHVKALEKMNRYYE